MPEIKVTPAAERSNDTDEAAGVRVSTKPAGSGYDQETGAYL
jgi:hypothetical protein